MSSTLPNSPSYHCLCAPIPTESSMSIQNCESMTQVNIPAEYHTFQVVFSKSKASSLPLYNCAIELLAGVTPPHNHVYSLSLMETKAMEEYIADALQQGYICLFTSPVSTIVCFVEKKLCGGLRPCIDY